MYSALPLWLALIFVAAGLVALAWSSDAFVDGSAAVARKIGISPFIVGMVIIGFGTCAPEFCVSIFSGASGHVNLSIGNAYGSCIFNLLGVLGVSALVAPIAVKPIISYLATPFLVLTALLAVFILRDRDLSAADSWLLLGIFAVLMPLYCWVDNRKKGVDAASASPVRADGNWTIAFNLVVGFIVMVAASHFLVWGSVGIAKACGAAELMIGLTIVAIGTSVPELATAIQSARKGESELVLGNIVGSNLFNMLVVVGAAGAICPTEKARTLAEYQPLSPYVLSRDLPLLIAIPLLLGLCGINWRKPCAHGAISRIEGAFGVVIFVIYISVMVYQEISDNG
ncbi:MAG: calcium/sodium antiporter [Kiritimatiellia bacterium]